MLSNDFLGNPLVKMSADCSVVGIYVIQICPLSIFSLMKCLSTSTCLVLSCRTGLCAIYIADLLSQYSLLEENYEPLILVEVFSPIMFHKFHEQVL